MPVRADGAGARRRVAAILRILSDAGGALGSARVARELELRGIAIRERMVRYYLDAMDGEGLTVNLGRPGRELTERGRQELEWATVLDRVGFVASRIAELAFALTFGPGRAAGTVACNETSIRRENLAGARDIMRTVMDAGLGVGRFVWIDEGARGGAGAPRAGKVVVSTVSSATLHGVLGTHGIPAVAKFGGLLELRGGRPFRFAEIVRYDSTSLDPMEAFVRSGMTRVGEAARTGNGVIGASLCEVPAAALPKAEGILEGLARAGLGCVLAVGTRGSPLLDGAVADGRAGLVVADGLNPVAAVQEAGIPTESRALSGLREFRRLV